VSGGDSDGLGHVRGSKIKGKKDGTAGEKEKPLFCCGEKNV
jgi:hypothetical protein